MLQFDDHADSGTLFQTIIFKEDAVQIIIQNERTITEPYVTTT